MLNLQSSDRFLSLLASTLVILIPQAYAHEEHHAHGHGHGSMSEVKPPASNFVNSTIVGEASTVMDSYYLWEEERVFLYAHIVTMIISWVFVLPFVLSFGIAKSRLFQPTGLVFLGGNIAGATCSVLYNTRTPDLYPNNIHHKAGWLIILLLAILTASTMLWNKSFEFSRAAGLRKSSESSAYARLHALDEEELDDLVVSPRRTSGDSGLGYERSSSSSEHSAELEDEQGYTRGSVPRSLPHLKAVNVGLKLQTRYPHIFTPTVLRVNDALSSFLLRLLPIIGFAQITSGLVTVTGIFVGSNVLNGLAHTVKGGIFFWYGVLSFGRFLGAFGEFGWAWNKRPRSKVNWINKFPSCEMFESSLILFYGTIDVFLEHLAAWGHEWTHMDLEHESIAILFFGGGLCGVMLESKIVRDLLYPAPQDDPQDEGYQLEYTGISRQESKERKEPTGTSPSLNVLPGLVIFLLGKSMSGHHQSSTLSVALHTQWGQLLSYAGIARIVTYILLYLSPLRTSLPSRPPTEVVASFCLMTGGLVFMLSNKDSIAGFEKYGYEGLFIFTLISALTAFLMGWIAIFMALKGWAVRRSA